MSEKYNATLLREKSREYLPLFKKVRTGKSIKAHPAGTEFQLFVTGLRQKLFLYDDYTEEQIEAILGIFSEAGDNWTLDTETEVIADRVREDSLLNESVLIKWTIKSPDRLCQYVDDCVPESNSLLELLRRAYAQEFTIVAETISLVIRGKDWDEE